MIAYVLIKDTFRFEEVVLDVIRMHLDHEEKGKLKKIENRLTGVEKINRDMAKSALIEYYLKHCSKVLEIFKSSYQLSAFRLLEQERSGLEQFVVNLSLQTVMAHLLPKGSKKELYNTLKTLCNFLEEIGTYYFSEYQMKSLCTSIIWLMTHTRPKTYTYEWYISYFYDI